MADKVLQSVTFPGLSNVYHTPTGDPANLTTTAKTDLVAAINEVDANADTNAASISTLNNQLNALGLSVVDGALNITYTEE